MADSAASEDVKENEAAKQDVEGNPQGESSEPATPKEAEEGKKEENVPESGKHY